MKTIGILGGVGPEATCELFKRIVRLTPARTDQEHIPIIIYNNPSIPDRTKSILRQGPCAVNELKKTASLLQKSGSDFILLPCNTAHNYLAEIQESIDIPVIDMIEETAKYIKSNHPDVRKVGLLATTGTIDSGIYERKMGLYGIEVILPKDESIVMEAIFGENGIKAGVHTKPKKSLEEVGERLITEGAEMVIAGCTEISIVLKDVNTEYRVIDPLMIIAKHAITRAMYPIELKNKECLISTD